MFNTTQDRIISCRKVGRSDIIKVAMSDGAWAIYLTNAEAVRLRQQLEREVESLLIAQELDPLTPDEITVADILLSSSEAMDLADLIHAVKFIRTGDVLITSPSEGGSYVKRSVEEASVNWKREGF